MADEIEDTFDKLKAGAKAIAKKVTSPDKDLGEEYEMEKGKETAGDYDHTDESGTKDPMSPEKIGSHEPSAVKRDNNQGIGEAPVTTNYENINNNNLEGTQKRITDDGGKSDESTPGVSASFSCEECGKTFGSRQELKDHSQIH